MRDWRCPPVPTCLAPMPVARCAGPRRQRRALIRKADDLEQPHVAFLDERTKIRTIRVKTLEEPLSRARGVEGHVVDHRARAYFAENLERLARWKRAERTDLVAELLRDVV